MSIFSVLVKHADDVLFQQVGGETVLLDHVIQYLQWDHDMPAKQFIHGLS